MSSSNDSVCYDRIIDLPYAIHGNLLLAMAIITGLAFLQRRKKKWQDCCEGRPGALIPVNMLDSFENRWSFACSFGAITNVLTSMLLGQQAYTAQADLLLAKFFLTLIYAVEVSIVFFPFFACLTIPQKKVGSVVGLCYTGLWSLLMLAATLECVNPYPQLVPYVGLLIQLPSLLCLGFLTVKFSIMTYHAYKKNQPPILKSKDTVAAPFQVSHVRTLLSKTSITTTDDTASKGLSMKIKRFISGKIYKNNPHFKYTTRIVCTFFIVISVIVQLGTISLIVNGVLFTRLADWARNSTVIEDGDELHKIVISLEALWIITVLFSVLFLCCDIFAILTKYRMNLLQLYKGDYSFFPHNFKDSSGLILRHSMVFPGYQIAYKIWGFAILNLVLLIFVFTFGFIFIIPLLIGRTDILIGILQGAIIPGIIGVLLKVAQTQVAKQFLLQEKIHPDDQEKPLALSNRRIYHITNYFLFIANIGLGVFSALFRLLLSVVWGVVLLGRVDRCVLVPGLETQDQGFKSYLGMVLVEHTHNNPTMRVFCQLLLNGISSKQQALGFLNVNCNQFGQTDDNVTPPLAVEQKLATQRRIRKKWLLLITLSNNPEIIPLRSHHIVENKTPQKKSVKILQILKTGVLGIIPAASGNGIDSHSDNNYQLRALVANQQIEKHQRSTPTMTTDEAACGMQTGPCDTGDSIVNSKNIHLSIDNEMYSCVSPDENC